MATPQSDTRQAGNSLSATDDLAASSEQLVILGLRAANGQEAIAALADRLVQAGYVDDLDLFLADVRKREEMISTQMPWNLAMPHARSNAVKQFAIALGRNDDGFMWDDNSDEPTKLVIMLAAPGREGGRDYMDVLSELATALIDDDFRESLLTGQNPSEVINAIAQRVALT
jgi:fructose-specific phosphotransferase system IIA component